MDYDVSSHEVLSAIIIYNTIFFDKATSKPIILSFALGIDVSVNAIAGIPLIR